MTYDRLAVVRKRIFQIRKKYPDDSRGESHFNAGIDAALRVIDYALDAPCYFTPTRYGQWCEQHHSPVNETSPMEGDRCHGYSYVRDQVLV